MMDASHRGAHWKSTKTNAAIAIVALAGILLLVSIFASITGGGRFLGFPLSFYLAAQGVFVALIILVYWSTGRQEKIDHRHGASEEI